MIEPTSERQRRLGEYLAARRAAVDPAKAGLRVAGPRRVVGLRREEVAVLAGVSVDYYTRLEQGRELHPSPAVLDGLCRALGLRADARPYLYRLAGAPEPAPDVASPCGVSPELAAFVQTLREPALVLDAALDVLARNALGEALHGGFTIADNIARMVFLDPIAPSFYEPWDRAAETTVASLRLAGAMAPDSPRFAHVAGELAAASATFRTLWARHAVCAKTSEVKRYRHPVVGALTFAYQSFDVRGVPGQQLVVFTNVPGDDSVGRLRSVASRPADDA